MDYAEQCWNCSKVTMKPKGTYYQCGNCGATWVPQPHIANSPTQPGPCLRGANHNILLHGTYTPSDSLTSKIAKERDAVNVQPEKAD